MKKMHYELYNSWNFKTPILLSFEKATQTLLFVQFVPNNWAAVLKLYQ